MSNQNDPPAEDPHQQLERLIKIRAVQAKVINAERELITALKSAIALALHPNTADGLEFLRNWRDRVWPNIRDGGLAVSGLHPDDIAVDRFADAMKAKLAQKRAAGYGGWEDKAECPQTLLSGLLHAHAKKGDPVDIANFAMMLHQRGESVLPDHSADQASDTIKRLIEHAGHVMRAHQNDDIDAANDSFRSLPDDLQIAIEAMAEQPRRERMGNITPRQRDILRHALGLNRGNQYRNLFVTGPGSKDHADCMALTDAGLMIRHEGSELTGGDDLFTVNDAGKEAAQDE